MAITACAALLWASVDSSRVPSSADQAPVQAPARTPVRRLAIELADLDRQLDEIEQSKRPRFEPKSDR